jgi:hypothetical protein
MSDHLSKPSRYAVIKAVFLRPWVWIVTTIWTAVSTSSDVAEWLAGRFPTLNPIIESLGLPRVSWQMWLAIFMALVAIAAIVGAYRFASEQYLLAEKAIRDAEASVDILLRSTKERVRQVAQYMAEASALSLKAPSGEVSSEDISKGSGSATETVT